MADDLAARVQALRSSYEAELIDEAAYLAGLARLRAKYGPAAVDAALLHPPAPQVNLNDVEADDVTIGDKASRDVLKNTSVQPLFSGLASGNNIASVINIFQQAPAAPAADYDAALRRYLDFLYASNATLELRGIDQRQMTMPLSEVYVSLTVREAAPTDGAQRGGMRQLIAQTALAELDMEPEREVTAEWHDVLRHQRLVVIGLPGSGKTTLLQYTTVRLCEVLARDANSQLAELGLATPGSAALPPVPLLLPLRELGTFMAESSGRERAGARPKLLLDCLSNYYNNCALDLPPDFFQRLCETGRAMLLLDGLDEVPQSDDRETISTIVESMVQRYRTCRYVLTSRPAAYEGDARLGQDFKACVVNDLLPEQQKRFIQNWSQSLHRLLGFSDRQATMFSAELLAALAANQRVRDLASNPLLLTIVAIIYYDSRSLPENRAELYDVCVTVLLKGGRDKIGPAAKGRETYSGMAGQTMPLSQKQELLAFVAFHTHQRGATEREQSGREISREELLALVALAPALPAGLPAAEAARAFVNELPVHVGLLDEIRPDIFRFSHHSFQEFLAARHVDNSDAWDTLLAHYGEPWWREVILLCAGLMPQQRCWRFLARLAEQGSSASERAAALLLAASALAELEKFKGQGPLRNQLQAAALEIVEAQPAAAAPAAARVLCGQALAIVGDPRPGVCELPAPFVEFAGGSFVIGSTAEEARQAGQEWEQYFLKRGDTQTAQQAKRWPENEINSQPLVLKPFVLARYPVTNGQFQRFIAAGGYDPAQPWWALVPGGLAWLKQANNTQPTYWDDPRFGVARPNHPVVGVTWYEAVAFGAWLTLSCADGYTYRLPSEAEWEYAARGPARRVYPWGKQPCDSERLNYENEHGGTSAVGCFPAGTTPEGLADMAGNVWEWCSTSFQAYPLTGDIQAETLYTVQAEESETYVLRGGSCVGAHALARCAYRNRDTPRYDSGLYGFRLARLFS